MKTIAFYNQKGGVGKTSLAVNFAAAAAAAATRTLLWDLDPQASATYILRIDEHLAPRAKALLAKKADLDEMAVRTNINGLMAVPSSTQLRLLAEKIFAGPDPSRTIGRVAKTARGSFDLLVIDAPPSLNTLSDSLLAAIDLLCVPLQPSPLAMHSLESLADHLAQLGLAKRAVAIYNMVDMRRAAHRQAVAAHGGAALELLDSYIPYSADVERMALERNPIYLLSSHAKITPAFDQLYTALAARLALARTPKKN